MLTLWSREDNLLINNYDLYESFSTKNHLSSNEAGFINHMTSSDILGYLTDDILVKVDRAAMGVSLETRIPLLGKDVIEFSMAVAISKKLKNNQTKWILRKVLEKYVPPELFNRKKMGFGVPINHWISNELRDWSENLLDKNKLKNQGYLNYNVIKKKFDEHISGEKNNQYYLWPILIFQQWLEEQ